MSSSTGWEEELLAIAGVKDAADGGKTVLLVDGLMKGGEGRENAKKERTNIKVIKYEFYELSEELVWYGATCVCVCACGAGNLLLLALSYLLARTDGDRVGRGGAGDGRTSARKEWNKWTASAFRVQTKINVGTVFISPKDYIIER